MRHSVFDLDFARSQVMLRNKREGGLVGILRSRIPKGMSINDRLNRIENNQFELRKIIDEKGGDGVHQLRKKFDVLQEQ